MVTLATNDTALVTPAVVLACQDDVSHKQTHNLSPLVVFTVLLQYETVYREGCHGVEEGKHSDGDKELS